MLIFLLKSAVHASKRFYSKEFIDWLVARSDDKVLEKRYLDFLINKNLKGLEFRFFRAEDLNYILEVLLPKMGDNLENVDFNFTDTVSATFQTFNKMSTEHYVKKVISHIPNVKTIMMEPNSNCDDSTLQVIYASCKKLKELCLKNCNITSAGLKNLCPEDKRENALNLQSLEIFSTGDFDEGVSYLMKNLPSLEFINYENLPNVLYKLHADDLRNNSLRNAPKYNLTSLSIHGTEHFHRDIKSFEETLFIASELCPRVSKINIIDVMGVKQLQILNRFSALSDLRIRGGDVSLDIRDFLRHSGKKLRKLDVRNFKLSISTLVENCPNLESLCLNDIVDIYKKVKSANILKNLRQLTFGFTDKKNRSAKMFLKLLLDACPNLDKLRFAGCLYKQPRMCGLIQEYCEKAQTLEHLMFDYCYIEVAFLQHIVLTCTPLKMVSISSCDINKRVHEIQNLREIIRASKTNIEIYLNDSDEDDSDDEGDLEDDEQMDDLSDN